MNRIARAVIGGVVGTTLMSLIFTFLEVQTRYVIGIFAVISRFVRMPGDLYVGFLVFAFAGSFVWPMLFLSLERYVPGERDEAVRGMALGFVLWIPFSILGRGDLVGPVLAIYVSFTLLAHLVYGFALGTVYATLGDEPANSTAET